MRSGRSICHRFAQVASVACMAAMALAALRAAPEPPRPNIVFILSDDQGWHDVGYHGAEFATPQIDQLARSGVRLEQFYAQPVCTPTRAAFLTGLYPMRLGLQLGVIKPGSRQGLPLGVETLPAALRDAGYTTAITGKWHLGNAAPEYLPTARGFDHQYGFYLGSIDHFTHEREGGLDWHRDDHALRETGYETDLIAAEAERLILQQPAERPLFLYVAFGAPHTPLQAPESQLARNAAITDKRRHAYASMITAMDDGIGRIIAALDKRRMRERTLVIFCSDNGGNLPAASNTPLRDQKGSVYEGGVRVPAFASWPGRIPAGSVVQQPLHMVDWPVTLRRLAGAADPTTAVDGRDLWAALLGDAKPVHEEILLNAAPGTGALRRGNWKLVVNGQLRFKNESPGPKFSWADLLRDSGLDPVLAQREQIELFDLAADPTESRDLAAQRPDVVRELKGRYDAYAAQAVPLLDGTVIDGGKTPAVWGEFPPTPAPLR
jgi:arylsulfatase A-like enzyme